MERIILHSDINSCYANIEHAYNRELDGKIVAVGGSEASRHGIILAKDEACKRFGVKTGMTIWQAKKLCPDITIVPPRMHIYSEFSKKVQKIYYEYTDICEPFGIDECWLDLTGCAEDGVAIAEEIRRRVRLELGVTVSIGVSWNKVFAKLGSDYKKPDAVTVISKDNFRDIVWKLPANDLLYVGSATMKKLEVMGIRTIGDVAIADADMLHIRLGKAGDMLHSFANGNDTSPVRRVAELPEIKSIGNGTTTPKDMESPDDVWTTLMALCESVGRRLREKNLSAYVVEISMRDTKLNWQNHQMKLRAPTDITKELLDYGFELFQKSGQPLPLRGIAIRAGQLIKTHGTEQLDMFIDVNERDRQRRLDTAMDKIRSKYGYSSLKRGTLEADEHVGKLDPKKDHTVHPTGFLKGYKMDEISGKD